MEKEGDREGETHAVLFHCSHSFPPADDAWRLEPRSLFMAACVFNHVCHGSAPLGFSECSPPRTHVVTASRCLVRTGPERMGRPYWSAGLVFRNWPHSSSPLQLLATKPEGGERRLALGGAHYLEGGRWYWRDSIRWHPRGGTAASQAISCLLEFSRRARPPPGHSPSG